MVFRFGIPRIIIIDNGSRFTGESWKNALEELEIQHLKASVAYPQANGQVEITNKAILQGLKKWLMKSNRNWVDEHPNVLWSLCTTPKASTGQTPFRMAYGTEVVLPMEISSRSLRIDKFDPKISEEGLRLNKNLL